MSMNDPYGRPMPRPETAGSGSGWIVGGVLALLLIFGIILWGGTGTDQQTAGVVDPPAATGPATTGANDTTAPPPMSEPSTTGSGSTD